MSKNISFLILLLFFATSNYSTAQIVIINEILTSPPGDDTSDWNSGINANSLYNIYDYCQPPINREWIELYNPDPCNTIDISCYTIAANAQPPSGTTNPNWGAFTFPSGTIIPPMGFLIIGGNNSQLQGATLDFSLTYYRLVYFQTAYLDGYEDRWFLRDDYGWLAIYDPNGNPVDAVYWVREGTASDLYIQEEFAHSVVTSTTCYGTQVLLAAKNIPGIEYLQHPIQGSNLSFQRITDGSTTWYGGPQTPTPGTCNAGCLIFEYNYQNTCLGDSTLFFTFNTTYIDSVSWNFNDPSTGAMNFSNDFNTFHFFSSAGNYNVELITYSCGIPNTHLLPVIIMTIPDVNLGNDTIICAGSSFVLNAQNPGSTYNWSTGQTSQAIYVYSSDVYYVTVTNACGMDSDSVKINISPLPVINLGTDTTICNNQTITFNAGAGFDSYLWQDDSSDSTFLATAQGTYWVVVTNSFNCSNSDVIELYVDTFPVADLGNDTLFCEGDSLMLDAGFQDVIYSWSTGDTTQTVTVDTSGIYYVEISNVCGIVKDSVLIELMPLPVVYLNNDTSIYIGESVQLNATEDLLFIYSWSPAEGLSNPGIPAPVAQPASTTTYSLTVTDIYGCQKTTDILITVLSKDVIIYNTFTPNGDGTNDIWEIKNIWFFPNNTVAIYNRNGNPVFKNNQIITKWDGKYNGKDLPAATYYYIIDLGNGSELIKGNVTIIR